MKTNDFYVQANHLWYMTIFLILWSGSATANTVGILEGSSAPGSVDFQLGGLSTASLTLPAEVLVARDYVIDLNTSNPTPNGHLINPKNTTLRLCLGSAVIEGSPFATNLQIELSGASWESNSFKLYLEEGRERQPWLDADLDVGNGTLGDEVIEVPTTVISGGAGSNSVTLAFSNTFTVPAFACLTLGRQAFGSSGGLISDGAGNFILRVLQGSSKVSVNVTRSHTSLIPMTLPTDIRFSTRFIEIMPQFSLQLTQPATSVIDVAASPSRSRFVEEGAANDVRSNNADTDATTSAATWVWRNDAALIEDYLDLESSDKLSLRLVSNGPTNNLRPASGVSIEYDNSGPEMPGTLVPFSASGGVFAGVLPASVLSNSEVSDDLLLHFDNNLTLPLSNQAWSLSATLVMPSRGLNQAVAVSSFTASGLSTAAFTLSFSQPGPGVRSTPVSGSTIDFGDVAQNHSQTFTLSLEEVGDSPLSLSVAGGGLSGDFQVLNNGLPTRLEDGSAPYQLQIQCAPSAIGLRSSVLTLNTNDPNQPVLSYSLLCNGVTDAPGYAANVVPGQMILLTSPALGQPVIGKLQISEIGSQTLRINPGAPLLDGPQAGEFKIVQNTPPWTIANGGASKTLAIQCTPSTATVYGATLHLLSNDPLWPTVTYPLACVAQGSGPRYGSFPVPGDMFLGKVALGSSLESRLYLLEAGDSTLLINSMSLQGTHEGDFKIIQTTAPPLRLADGSTPVSLKIQCTPSELGVREAELVINNNDPSLPSARYALRCQGGLGKPPTDILLSNAQLTEGSPVDTPIGLLTSIDPDAVDTHRYQLVEDAGGYFKLSGATLQSNLPLPYLPSQNQYRILVRSIDSGNLRLERPFTITVLPGGLVSATLHSNEVLLTQTDLPQVLSLKGQIKPASVHLGQLADIFVGYHYTSPSGQVFDAKNLLLKAQTPLSSEMAFLLYQGRLLYLPGTFEVTLHYQLADHSRRGGLATVFYLQPNRPPTAIQLDGQQVAENSPTNTVIGMLHTTDPDRDDFFRYALIENPGQPFGHFKIVGNELRLADSFPLDFEENAQLEIVVRSLDSAGAALDQRFSITVDNQVDSRISAELHSAGQVWRGLVTPPPLLGDSQPFSIFLTLRPDGQHQAQSARIYYRIQLKNLNGATQNLEGTLVESLILPARYQNTFFEGLPAISGAVKLWLGYQLDTGEKVEAQVLDFLIKPDQALDNSLLINAVSPSCLLNQPPALRLAQALETLADTSPLAQFNLLPAVQAQQLLFTQDGTGLLQAHFDDVQLSWWPIHLRYSNAPADVALSPYHELQLTTALPALPALSLQLTAVPALANPCALVKALQAADLSGEVRAQAAGGLHVALDATQYLSLMPQIVSFPAAASAQPGWSALDADRYLLIDSQGAQRRQQVLLPTPAWPAELARLTQVFTSLADQSFSFSLLGVTYQGKPAAHVSIGTQGYATALQVEETDDQNNDGNADFIVQYSNGDRQVFYRSTVTPTP